ncbi:PdaC/SigV domain-containing protein [Qipengyuania vesicularis]|uniref:PdaC/SigV domain-containing protein n=1 Tax=Qipengyuania vesicularis TaxID=2867232 RepID=UPI001C88A481|nr:DUF4163 domain-containing protein [Qipengyuania vesicularis]MBX7527462.1 DUF3298 and DUF4163 domain-containing protein [Qipengyuania vesicularis]
MRAPLFLISLALSSVACSETSDSGEAENAVATVSASAATSPTAAADAVEMTDKEERDGGTREFTYSWPAAVSEQTALAERFEQERDAALGAQKEEWERSLVDFPGDCVACKGRGYEKEWKVVADLSGWLSLSADIYEYTGGAHGNYTRQSLVWDKQNEIALAGSELFKSPVALETALGSALCDGLNIERERKRGMPVDSSAGDLFNDCPGLDEASIFVGSSDGEYFDRIGIYFGPYVAGSYAEGAYELNFPVTASVIDAVRPEYAGAFRVKR